MSASVPQVGDLIASKYRVESVLGRGGMGVVFAARHTLSERRVAVKWMEADLQDEPDALERFVREARAMGRIEHPNVVGVLDVGTEGSIAYLVMDILRGESLRALMTRGPMTPELALATILPVMEGVEAAHRAGVIHRDLKPENLFVVRGPSGEAQTTKVLDFGISKLTEHEAKKLDAKRLTKTGHVVGTPAYMSPEQVRGVTIDARTDVWALSTILYEMLASKTPFDAPNYGALLVSIATEPYAPLDPNLVAPDLARVIHRGLAKEPEDRWASVIELARALEPFARGAKFVEPHRPSLVPMDPVRSSTAPTLPQAPARAPIEETPELDVPPPRIAAPTPIRIARPERPVSEPATAEPPPRRTMTIVAVAIAVVIVLVVVLRGIGNAARDAAFAPRPTTTASAPPPITRAPAPTTIPVTVVAEPVPVPVPVPSAVIGIDPPTTHVRHGTHATPPTSGAPAASATPPTTSTSRSGSISRDDF